MTPFDTLWYLAGIATVVGARHIADRVLNTAKRNEIKAAISMLEEKGINAYRYKASAELTAQLPGASELTRTAILTMQDAGYILITTDHKVVGVVVERSATPSRYCSLHLAVSNPPQGTEFGSNNA